MWDTGLRQVVFSHIRRAFLLFPCRRNPNYIGGSRLKGLGVGAAGTGLLAVAGFYFYQSHKQRQLAEELKEEQARSAAAESVGESANCEADEGNNESEIK